MMYPLVRELADKSARIRVPVSVTMEPRRAVA